MICLFHKYKRISDIYPIEDGRGFDGYIGHYAIGRCEKCGRIKPIKCSSLGFSWSTSDHITFKQLMEVADAKSTE